MQRAPPGSESRERTESSKKALEEAVAQGETTKKIDQLSGYVEFSLKQEAKAKQQITMVAAGGIVSIIIAVVLWFVSLKKSDDTKDMTSESEQAI